MPGAPLDFKHTKAALDKAHKKHESISVDEKILKLAADVEQLTNDKSEARFRTSGDIADRQKEIDVLGEGIARMLAKLGRSGFASPVELVLPTSTNSTLSTLIDKCSGIDTLMEQAEQELIRANGDVQQAEETLSKSGTFKDLTIFNELFRALSSGYPEADLRAIESNIARLEQEVRFAMHQLAPWQGTPEELLDLVPPSNSNIKTLKSTADDIASYQRSTGNTLHEVDSKVNEIQAEIDARSTLTKELDDQMAANARAAREQAWVNHRVLLEAPLNENMQSEALLSAENFETTMNDDDAITEARFHHTSELADLRQLQIELGKSRSKQQTHQQRLEGLDQSEDRLRTNIAEVMDSLNLPTNTPLAELDRWLDKRIDAIDKFKLLELERQNQSLLASTASKKSDALASSMKTAGLPIAGEDWTTATTMAAQAIEEWKNTSRDRLSASEALKTAQKRLKTRETEVTNAIKEKLNWKQQWRETLRSCWLGQNLTQQSDDQHLSPTKVRGILNILVDLEQQISKSDELRTRIVEMQAERDNYITEVERIDRIAEQDGSPNSPLAMADALRARTGQRHRK